jgi:hypothetical protein
MSVAGERQTFAHLLRVFMDEQKMSSNALAKSLYIDASMVRRWLSGKAVPSIRMQHLDRMKVLLRLTNEQCMQLVHARDAWLKERGQLPAGYTPPVSQGSELATEILRVIDAGRQQRIESELQTIPSGGSLPSTVTSTQALLTASIALLVETQRNTRRIAPTVLQTFHGRRTAWSEYAPLYDAWVAIQERLLKDDRSLEHLLRMNEAQSTEMIAFLVDLIRSHGNYAAYYYQEYTYLSPPLDFLIVRGIGAICYLSTRQDRELDAAMIIRDPEQVSMLVRYFDALRGQTKPLLEILDHRKDSDVFLEWTTKVSVIDEPWYVIQDRIGIPTLSPNWPYMLALWHNEKQDPVTDVRRMTTLYQRALRAMTEPSLTAPFREVCLKSAMMHWTQALLHSDDPESAERHIPLSIWFTHLETTLRLVESDGSRYKLALLDDRESPPLPHSFLAVQGDHTALLGTWGDQPPEDTTTSTAHPARYVITTEPMSASGFRTYCENLWNRIPTTFHETAYIHEVLLRQIDLLRNKFPDIANTSHEMEHDDLR